MKLAYDTKVTRKERKDIQDFNKGTADDWNDIKTVVNTNDDLTTANTAGIVVAKTGVGTSLDTTNFDTNLSSADDTVQKAMETLDELASGGGGTLAYKSLSAGFVGGTATATKVGLNAFGLGIGLLSVKLEYSWGDTTSAGTIVLKIVSGISSWYMPMTIAAMPGEAATAKSSTSLNIYWNDSSDIVLTIIDDTGFSPTDHLYFIEQTVLL